MMNADFLGWRMNCGTVFTVDTVVNSNLHLTADWSTDGAPWLPAPYQNTVTFDPSGGSLRGTTVPTVVNFERSTDLRALGYQSIGAANLTPSRSGYVFDGWVLQDGRTFTATTLVGTNMTATARWIRAVAPPAETPAPPEPPADPATAFDDVNPGHWFFTAVTTVTTRGLFQGTGNRQFSPDATMTRAMFVQVLANLDGAVTTSAQASPFPDVSTGAWYAGAVNWAYSLGITNTRGNYFAPNDSITREEIAFMLHNYVSVRRVVLPSQPQNAFADRWAISPWATDAVFAMQNAGIISGRPGGNFDPTASATRAEVASIFSQFLQVAGN